MNPTKDEILPLTGIRGIAAMCVLLAHYVFWVSPVAQAMLPPELVGLFSLPYTGMTIFFVLSGFVIAYNYVEMPWKQRPANTTARFMMYRVARLYPLLLFFSLIIIRYRMPALGIDALLTDPKILRDLLMQFSMTQSWTPHLDAAGKLVIDGSFFVSWSISTEFFLYISFAAMMLVYPRFRLRLVIGYLAVAALLLLWWSHQNNATYFETLTPADYERWLFDVSPYYRMIEFGFGMVAYWFYKHAPVKALQQYGGAAGFLVLAGVYIASNLKWMIPAQMHIKLLVAAGVALILQACTQKNMLNRALSSKLLVYIGTISYSIYLFHYLAPNLLTRHSSSTVFDERMLLLFSFNMAITIAFTLVLATGLYYIVEVPGRRLLRRMSESYLRR